MLVPQIEAAEGFISRVYEIVFSFSNHGSDVDVFVSVVFTTSARMSCRSFCKRHFMLGIFCSRLS